MAQWFPSGQFHCLREGIIVFIIKFHGISSNHELVVYAWLPCACKCSCMRSTRTPFLTTSHELIFRLMDLTISLRRASMICLQMKRSTLSTLLRVVSNMERNIVNNMTTQLSFGMEGELGKPWPKIGVILWTTMLPQNLFGSLVGNFHQLLKSMVNPWSWTQFQNKHVSETQPIINCMDNLSTR